MPFVQGGDFTFKAQEAMMLAQRLARERRQQQVDALHLLLALLTQDDSIVLTLLNNLQVDIEDLKRKTERSISQIPLGATGPQGMGQVYLTQDLAQVLDHSRQEALEMADEFISIEHLFLGLLGAATSAQGVLKNIKFTSQAVNVPLTKELVLNKLSDIRGGEKINDPNPESKFEVIKKYSRNLTNMAKEGKLDPVIGREVEIKRVMQVLSRRTKNNPVLIGEAGVGKTAIVEGLAKKIISSDVPESLRSKEIIALDLGALIAGTKYRGEFEARLKAFMREVKRANDHYVLFIDELHTLVGAGAAEGSIDASNLLKPALARGELRAIGATTIKEYQKYIEKDPALERRFQPILVAEPSVDNTVSILRGIKEKYELHHGVKILDSSIKAAAELSNRYITDRFLPDKAVDLMDEAASALRLTIESEPPELEELKDKITKLKIEKKVLNKEKGSDKRLKVVDRSIADLNEKAESLRAKWGSEKGVILEIKDLKKKIDDASFQIEVAEREGQLDKAAELKYGQIPELKKQLSATDKKLQALQKKNPVLKEEVTEEDIAQVVSRWTGIPVTRLIEAEVKKLEKMDDILNQRVIGQEEAITAVSNAIRRGRAGIADEEQPMGVFLFLGPTGVGKCVTPDTILFTHKGILPIEKFIPKDLKEDKTNPLRVKLYGRNGIEFTSQVYNGGVKPTLKVKTSLGYEIEGTLVHPILTLNQNGEIMFKKLQNLSKGDYVVIQRNQQYFGDNKEIKFNFEKNNRDHCSQPIKIPKILTEDLARFFGYLVGEGCTVNKKTTRFSNTDKCIIEDTNTILKSAFGLRLIHYNCDKPQDFWIHGVWFRRFLEEIGINYGRSDSKEIPEIILRAPREFVVEYLRGYFEAEGSPIPSSHRIEIATASEKMAKQVHVILLNFGIVSNFRKTFNKKIKKFYYRIEIFGENIDIFAKEIGFLSKEKIGRLKALLNKKRNPNVDTIPFLKEKLIQLKERYFESGYNYCGISHTYCLQNWYLKNISYNTLESVLEEHRVIETTPQFRILENILEQHYLCLPIVDIIPGKSQVYDFVVPGTHSFFGNGFINHNTETARALADFLFNTEKALVRVDMSEYMEKYSTSKIIGSPPGYVGHEEGGQLTEKIRRRPYSVVLLDEIEKAHPEVFNILLQIFEDGRLTDAKGRMVSFKNTIIIMTSNLGSDFIAEFQPIGFGNGSGEVANKKQEAEEKIRRALKEEFKPEFLNRIDETIVFNYLGKKEIRQIVDLELSKVESRLQKSKEIKLNISTNLRDHLAEKGFDPNLGARPLKRVIQKLILDPLSLQIISGSLKPSGSVMVDVKDNKVTFQKSAASKRKKSDK